MQTRKIVGLLVLAAGGVVLGASQYMSHGDKARTTEAAAGAFAAVADAANRITADNTSYAIEVVTRVGMGRVHERDEQMAVLAAIGVRGGGALADVCTSLPRVRDAINAVVTDRIVPRMRDKNQVLPDELVADGRVVLASLNRFVQKDAVTAVRLTLKPARDVQDSGCNNRTKTANAAHPD